MEAQETLRFRYVSGAAIEQLPDDVPLDEIVWRLGLLDKVQRGLMDADAGNTSSAEELAQEIETW